MPHCTGSWSSTPTATSDTRLAPLQPFTLRRPGCRCLPSRLRPTPWSRWHGGGASRMRAAIAVWAAGVNRVLGPMPSGARTRSTGPRCHARCVRQVIRRTSKALGERFSGFASSHRAPDRRKHSSSCEECFCRFTVQGYRAAIERTLPQCACVV